MWQHNAVDYLLSANNMDYHKGIYYNYKLNNGMMNSTPSPCGNSQGSTDSQESSSMSTSPPSSVTMSPNCLYNLLNVITPEEQLEYNISNLSAMQNTDEPFLTIVEEPVEKFRFRYKSEMNGAHGCLTGRNSDRQRKKVYPAVKLNNYNCPAVIHCSLWTNHADPSQRFPHAHRLVIRNDRNEEVDDPHVAEVDQNCDYTASFPSMGILHTAKKYVVAELVRKKKERKKLEFIARNENNRELTTSQLVKIKAEATIEAKSIDLNVVSLCFECFTPDMVPICTPVFSSLISNMKSALTGELKITRIDKAVSCCYGDEEVFMLVEKVGKNNIEVKIFELDDEDNEVWSADGKFSPLDVHHQYAIVFRTPPYRDLYIEKTKEVYIKLYRPTDKCSSEPIKFMYKPSDKTALLAGCRKRQRRDSSIDRMTFYNSNPMLGSGNVIELEFLESFPSNTLENEIKTDLNSETFTDYLKNNSIEDLFINGLNENMELVTDGVRSKSRRQAILNQLLKGQVEKPQKIKTESQDEASPQKLSDPQSKSNPNSNVAQTTDTPKTEDDAKPSSPQPGLLADSKSEESSSNEEDESSDDDSPLYISLEEGSLPVNEQGVCMVLPESKDNAPPTANLGVILEPGADRLTTPIPDDEEKVPAISQKVTGDASVGKKTRKYTKRFPTNERNSTYYTRSKSDASKRKFPVAAENLSNQQFEEISMTPDESLVLQCPDMSFAPNMILNERLDSVLFKAGPKDTLQVRLLKRVTEDLAKLIREKKDQPPQVIAECIFQLFRMKTGAEDTVLHVAVSHDDKRYLNRMLSVLCAGRQCFGDKPCKEISDIVNAQNSKLETCLHLAILRNQTYAVKFLLLAGANPNITNCNGNAPLHLAVNNAYKGCIIELLRDSNYKCSSEKLQHSIKNEQGWSPLHLAALKNSWFAVNCLLSSGADANESDITGGRTVLHIAVEEQDRTVVKNLCALEAMNIDQQNLAGNTALHLAVTMAGANSVAICRFLLRAGANPLLHNFNTERPDHSGADRKVVVETKRNDFRMTPLDLAVENTKHITPSKKKMHSNDKRVQIRALLENWIRDKSLAAASNYDKYDYDNTDDSEKSSSSSFSSESSEENGLFDRITMEKLCTLLDKNKGWEKLVRSLEFDFLMGGINGTSSPSRLVLNYADVYSAETPEIIRDHLYKLGKLEAAKIAFGGATSIVSTERGCFSVHATAARQVITCHDIILRINPKKPIHLPWIVLPWRKHLFVVGDCEKCLYYISYVLDIPSMSCLCSLSTEILSYKNVGQLNTVNTFYILCMALLLSIGVWRPQS